jgi:hypothetical protein
MIVRSFVGAALIAAAVCGFSAVPPARTLDPSRLFEGDVLVVNNNPRTLVAVTAKKTLQPLAIRASSGLDEGPDIAELVLYEDEERQPLALHDVDVHGAVADVVFTQRCVEDRVSNPHGEHAEDVWVVGDRDVIARIMCADIVLPRRTGH